MKWIARLLLVVICNSVQAQQDVSFQQALMMMAKNNHALSAARYSVDAAYEEYRAAQGLRLPHIEAMGAYAYMSKDIDIDIGGAKGVVTESVKDIINKGVSSGYITPNIALLLESGLSPIMNMDWQYRLQRRSFGSLGVVLTMPIYAGGRINVANRAAKLNIDIAEQQLNGVENTLVTELVERYYGVVLAREVVDVRGEMVESVNKHLSDARMMEDEGLVAHSAVLYIEYKLSEAKRDYTDAVHKLEVAKLALQTTVKGELEINPLDKMFIDSNVYSIDYYREMAIKLNPIICGANTTKHLSEEGVALAKSALLPEVFAIGGASLYNYQISSLVPRWVVGVGARFTIFGGMEARRMYMAAQNSARSVSDIVEKTKDDVLLLVDKEYYTLINSIYAIESCQRSIDFAESYYTTIQEGFIEGVSSSTDLMDARTELAATRVEYLNSVYNYCLSLARLLEAAGLSNSFVDYQLSGHIVDI